ncbi:MAG: hypothetical protein N2442_09445 [Spirochaetes bacterium]|nr:hypothetical protein [Spirochaetota bacterium]
MAISQPIEEKVNDLETAIRELIYLQHKNEMQIHQLTVEMREFKDEMKEFKDEMKEFKDEMKEFKDEMKEFKDEMKGFKDEILGFKEEILDFKNEIREENRQMNKRWGELSNKMGTIVEDLVYPSINPLLARYFNLEPIDTAVRIRRKKGSLSGEFDALAICEDRVFIFEVKAGPRKEYIEEFVNRQIPLFRSLFPEHENKMVIPILAALRFEEPLVKECTSCGVYAMAYREWDYMDLLNFEDLK